MRQSDGSSLPGSRASSVQITSGHPVNWRLVSSLFAVVAAIALGCSYGKGAPYAENGRLFPWKNVPLVTKGMTQGDVRKLLGDPLEVKVEGEIERWRYFVQERQEEHIRVL